MQRGRVAFAQATEWRRGRVSFVNGTLDEIISYNARKMRVPRDALRTRHYRGQFNARDPESFIDYLRQDDGIEIVEIQGGPAVTPDSSDTKFSHRSGPRSISIRPSSI